MQQEHYSSVPLQVLVRIRTTVNNQSSGHICIKRQTCFLILLSTQSVKIFTKHYKLSFVDVSQCAVFSCEEFVRGISNLKHRYRAILGCRPSKIGDVNCDDETPSIRRMPVSSEDWQKSGVVGNPDIQKDPATRNSLDLDKCRSIRSHNRPCRA